MSDEVGGSLSMIARGSMLCDASRGVHLRREWTSASCSGFERVMDTEGTCPRESSHMAEKPSWKRAAQYLRLGLRRDFAPCEGEEAPLFGDDVKGSPDQRVSEVANSRSHDYPTRLASVAINGKHA